MPELVSKVLEFPFAHGGCSGRHVGSGARQLRQQFDVAYVCPELLQERLVTLVGRYPSAWDTNGKVVTVC